MTATKIRQARPSTPATPRKHVDAPARPGQQRSASMLTLLLVSMLGMSVGLWIDTRDMPAAVLISRCTQSSGWVQAILLHGALMPATSLLMLLAPWLTPARFKPRRLTLAVADQARAEHRRVVVQQIFCGLLMFVGMVLGARYASQMVLHLNLAPFFGLLMAMTVGMACALILFDGARRLARQMRP